MPREWLENYQDTYWTLESTITIEMAGLRWTNIPITKEMIYNGGLSARNSPVTVQVANSDLYGGLNEPGLRLQLQLNNTAGLVGIHAGDLRFDVASAYSRNKTQRSQELVKLLSVRLPDFKYVSGVSNITIENNVELGSLKQLRAAAQLGTNYLANRTSTIMLRGFHAHYAWMPEEGVSWVNNVLGTLAFIVQVNRPQSLGGMMMDKANRSWAGVTTSFTSLVNDNPWMNDGYLTTDGMRTAGPPVSAKSEAAHDLAASSDFRPEFTLEDAKALLRGDLSVDKNGSVVATR